VVVAVDVDAVGDRDAVADREFAPIVEVNVVVDDGVVADRDVVTVGERDSLEEATVVPAIREEVVGEHPPESQRELDVVRDGKAVELPPEPLEVLGAAELRFVPSRRSTRSRGSCYRGIVALQADAFGRGNRLASLPALVGFTVAREVDQDVFDDRAGIPRRSQAVDRPRR